MLPVLRSTSLRGAADFLDYKFKELLLEPEDRTEENSL
jgi:hypothetical protein